MLANAIFNGSVPFVRAEVLGISPSNTAAQNNAAWDAAMASIPIYGVGHWVFSAGVYNFESTLHVRRQLVIEGEGGVDSSLGTVFKFGASLGDTPGIKMAGYYDPLGDGRNSVIRHLRVQGPITPATPNQHGVLVEMTCLLEHLYVEYFGGHGVNISGDVAAQRNANQWGAFRVSCANNTGFGFFTHGSDSNGGCALMCQAISNVGGGFWEDSFLGNFYKGCLAEGNGVGPTRYGFRGTGPTNMSSVDGFYCEAPQLIDWNCTGLFKDPILNSDAQIIGGGSTLYRGNVYGRQLSFITNNNRDLGVSGSIGSVAWGGPGSQVGVFQFPPDADPADPTLALFSIFTGAADVEGDRVTQALGLGLENTVSGPAPFFLSTRRSVINPAGGWVYATDGLPVMSGGAFLGYVRAYGPNINSFSNENVPATSAGLTFYKGAVTFEQFFVDGGYSMCRCTKSGTTGIYTEGRTFSAAGGSQVVQLSAPSNVLKRGMVLKLNGSGAYRVLQISGTSMTLNQNVPAADGAFIDYANPIFVPFGELTGGIPDATSTPGAVTQNTLKGRVAIPAEQGHVVVTNSLITPTSCVFAQVQTIDETLKTVAVACESGSMLIKGNAAATNAVNVCWKLQE